MRLRGNQQQGSRTRGNNGEIHGGNPSHKEPLGPSHDAAEVSNAKNNLRMPHRNKKEII